MQTQNPLKHPKGRCWKALLSVWGRTFGRSKAPRPLTPFFRKGEVIGRLRLFWDKSAQKSNDLTLPLTVGHQKGFGRRWTRQPTAMPLRAWLRDLGGLRPPDCGTAPLGGLKSLARFSLLAPPGRCPATMKLSRGSTPKAPFALGAQGARFGVPHSAKSPNGSPPFARIPASLRAHETHSCLPPIAAERRID